MLYALEAQGSVSRAGHHCTYRPARTSLGRAVRTMSMSMSMDRVVHPTRRRPGESGGLGPTLPLTPTPTLPGGDQVSRATFFFQSPTAELCDREVVFTCVGGEWRAEG